MSQCEESPDDPTAADPAALSLRLRGLLGEIDRLQAAVAAFCRRHDLPPQQTFHVSLALDELVTNIISYAYEEAAESRQIAVRLNLQGRELWVEVVDDGRPFDPRRAAPPRLDLPLEERPIGGLGLHLVRSLVDIVEYERDKCGNRLILRKTMTADLAPGGRP